MRHSPADRSRADRYRNFEDFIETEADASAVRNVEIMILPGRLQTTDYADALLRTWMAHPDEHLVAERSQLRQQRQARLDEENPLHLHAIIHENALRLPIGGRATMQQQLDRVNERAEQSNVTVQVLPTEAGAYPGMGTAYHLIYFDNDESPAVYLDSLTDGHYLEEESDVAAYTLNYERLCGVAYDPDKSSELVQRIREEWSL